MVGSIRSAERSSERRGYAAIAVLAMLLALQVVHSWRSPAGDAAIARDFKAFYCAGAAVNAGADPYLAAPFARCGVAPRTPLPPFARADVWPAPLPPYAIAVFRAFALMPYRVAALVWLALSLAVLSFAVVALARMSRLPTLAVFAAFAMPLYYFNLQWGQLPPLVVGALVATALAFRRKTYPLAGLACLVTAIEPHIGLPVCLTVFVLEPRTRATIAAGALGLGVLSIATCGVSVNLDYLRTVLPLQAMAEAPAANQYSLTWLAWFLGAPEAVALRLGFAWYVLATLVGVSLARAVARRFADEAFVAFVPAATVVLGGSFVHVTQTSVAIPLALLLFRYVDRASPLLWLGVALQIPMWFEASWAGRAFTPTRVESLVAVAAFVWLAAAPLARGRRTAAALLAGVAYLVLSSAIIRSPQMPIRSTQSAAAYDRTLGSDRRYTTGAWGTHIRADPVSRTSSVRSGAEKVPVWLGLAALLALCVGATATGRARPRAREALDTPGAGSPSCR